ncbi:MAG: hypothetical protein H7A24_03885 [Leptospiraceae bacterium]|nr:hypothetical protein [Leptospiraceae bacterium]MCP5510993.1 hypothetical protein [Leptospiraceae bacterium]
MKYIIKFILLILVFGMFYWFLKDSEVPTSHEKKVLEYEKKRIQKYKNGGEKTSLFEEKEGFLDFTSHKQIRDLSEMDPISKEELIERYKFLSDRFPDNQLIPRYYPPDVLEKKEAEIQKMYLIQNKILENEEITVEEKKFYFHYRSKLMEDRIQLFDYALTNNLSGDSLVTEYRDKFLDLKSKYDQVLTGLEDSDSSSSPPSKM